MPRPPTIKRWTREEDQLILDRGASLSSEKLAELLPGRTRQAVKTRCHVLKVQRTGPLTRVDGVVRRQWTPEEEELLVALCGQVTLGEAAARLGRTKDSLKMCSKRLHLDWRRPAKPKKPRTRKPAIKKPPEPPKKLTVPVTRDLIHSRAVFARALVLLEKIHADGAAVSLWGVMSQLRLAQPWGENPDSAYILEAAERLGMRAYEEKSMLLLK